MPCASVSRLRLTLPLPRSVGLGLVFFPSQECLGHRAIQRQPEPVDFPQRRCRQQPMYPEFLEHARLHPFLKTSMRRTAGTNTGAVQGIPLATRTQYKQNGVHGCRSLTRGLRQPSGCGLRGGKGGSIFPHSLSGKRQPSSCLTMPMFNILLQHERGPPFASQFPFPRAYWDTLLIHRVFFTACAALFSRRLRCASEQD